MKARVTTFPSAVLPKLHTRQGYIGSSPRRNCCRAIREAGMEGSLHLMLANSIGRFFPVIVTLVFLDLFFPTAACRLRLRLLIYHGVGFPCFCAVSLLGFLETVLEASCSTRDLRSWPLRYQVSRVVIITLAYKPRTYPQRRLLSVSSVPWYCTFTAMGISRASGEHRVA